MSMNPRSCLEVEREPVSQAPLSRGNEVQECHINGPLDGDCNAEGAEDPRQQGQVRERPREKDAEAIRRRKELRTAGRPRYKARAKERHLGHVEEVLAVLPGLSPPPYESLIPAAWGRELCEAPIWEAVWRERVPEAADPACGGRLCGEKVGRGRTVTTREALTSKGATGGAADGLTPRAKRKRWQVASFALALKGLLGGWGEEQEAPRGTRVIDFGCGSGNLILPLAALFPHCSFVGIDMKSHAVKLAGERVKEAGLSNVQLLQGMIEHYKEPYDVALGLHACGNATDFLLLSAEMHRAAYIVCPCCVGKLKFSTAGGSSFSVHHTTWQGLGNQQEREHGEVLSQKLVHPRSNWMRAALAEGKDPEQAFRAVAQAADYSHQAHHSHPELGSRAKTAIEVDRNAAASEAGYATALVRLLTDAEAPEAKSDLLIGAPNERRHAFQWVWKHDENNSSRGE